MVKEEHLPEDLDEVDLEDADPLAILEKYRPQIHACDHTRDCIIAYAKNPNLRTKKLPVCPCYEHYKFESHSGNGRMLSAKALIEGKIDPTNTFVDITYQCQVCGACLVQCPHNIHLVDIIEATRAYLVEKKISIPQPLADIQQKVLKTHNIYGEPEENRRSWIPSNFQNPAEPDLVFFVGCSTSYKHQDLAQAILRVFQKLDIKAALLEKEYCCGSPLIRTGQIDFVDDLALLNIEEIEKTRAPTVVSTCPHCFKTLEEDYPRIIGSVDFDNMHITEFLVSLIQEGKFKPKLQHDLQLTFHDPCNLGRHLSDNFLSDDEKEKWFDIPRSVLRTINSGSMVEMERNKENAWCCGAGGGVNIAYPEFAEATCKKRIQEAEQTGANILVNACQFCHENFQKAKTKTGSNIQLFNIIELIDKVL